MQMLDCCVDVDLLIFNGVYVFIGSVFIVVIGDVVDVDVVVDNYYYLIELKNLVVNVVLYSVVLFKVVVFDVNMLLLDFEYLFCGVINFQCFISMWVKLCYGMINIGNKCFSGELFVEVSIIVNGLCLLCELGVVYGVLVFDGVSLFNWDGNLEVFKMNIVDFGVVLLNMLFNVGFMFEVEGVIFYDFGVYMLILMKFKLKYVVELLCVVDKVLLVVLCVGVLNIECFCDIMFDIIYICSGDSKELILEQVQFKIECLVVYIGLVFCLFDVVLVEEVKNFVLLQGLVK